MRLSVPRPQVTEHDQESQDDQTTKVADLQHMIFPDFIKFNIYLEEQYTLTHAEKR